MADPPDDLAVPALPAFNEADRVSLFAVELGLALEPWQFDFLQRVYADGPPRYGALILGYPRRRG